MISMHAARSLWLTTAFVLMLSWQTNLFAATSGTDLGADDDTFIRSNSTGSPGGTSPNTPKENVMQVGNYGGPYEARMLVHFDLTQFTGLAVGSTISNATLKLSYTNNSAATGDVANKLKVYRVTNTWQGGNPADATQNIGASWDRRYSSVELWTTVGGDYTGAGIVPSVATTPATGAVVEWNVTSIVNDWINNGQTNNGFIIVSDLDSPAADHYRFDDGSDYGGQVGNAGAGPQLNVTYTSVTSTTITPSQDAGIRSSVNNIGADPQMRLVGATENILLKFPLAAIPNNTQVAILRLKSSDGGQAGTDVATAYKLSTAAWTEGTGTRAAQTNDGVTWTTSDGATAWTTAGGDFDNTRAFASPSTTISGSNVDVTFDIDISALVVEAQAASATTVDVIVVPGAGCDWRLATKEYAGGIPAAPRPAQLIVASSSAALPAITVPTPATVANGASQTITWTYAGGAMSTFDVYLGDGTTFKKISGAPVAGTAGNGTFTWTVDTTGLIAPPASTYVVKIVEATKLFQQTSAAFTITAPATPVVISTASPITGGQQTIAYAGVTFAATGGTGPYTWAATNVPTGLTLSAGGSLTGTPTTNGTFVMVVTATDSLLATGTKNISITITPAPGALAITSGTPPNPVINVPYSFTATATGGTAPYTWSATGLPAGITINAGTGVISGTATTLGGSTWVITVTDAVPTSIASPGTTVTVVAASASTGKKGGCEVGGFSTDTGALLILLAAAGLLVVVSRRQTLTA